MNAKNHTNKQKYTLIEIKKKKHCLGLSYAENILFN